MKHIGKRALSLLCAAVMLMSMVAMIIPSVRAEYVSVITVSELDALLNDTHTAHYRQYLASDESVWSNTGSGRVDDSSAAGGKALLHDWNSSANSAAGTDMTNQENAVKIVWSRDGAAEIGRVNSNNVIIDDTYHVYKMKFTVPDSIDENGFFYLFGTWQLQLKTMPGDLVAWKGQTIDLYLSMKVSGEETAANCYVDRVVIMNSCDAYLSEDGSSCTACGKAFEEETLSLTFTADDFTLGYGNVNGDAKIDDPDSAEGRAVFVTYDGRAAFDDAGMMSAVIFGNGKNMKIHANTGSSDIVAGEITIEELRANMGTGYHTYIFRDVVLLGESDTSILMYFFEDWSIQLKLQDYVEELKGKPVDIALSMKITGNVSDVAENTPCYYIDKVVITEEDYVEEHTHAYGEWAYADETNHSASCECGDIKTEAHTWDDGVLSGTQMLYTCSVCGGTKTEVPEELTFTFLADDFTLGYGNVNGDAKIDDPDSAEGRAVFVTYDGRAAFDDAGMMSAVIFGNGKNMKIHANTGPSDIVAGEITIEELRANMGTGYHTYIFRDVVLLGESDTSILMYFFEDWSIQLKLQDYVDVLKDKPVDIALSMKITGNVSDVAENTPCYYIDKVVITTGTYGEEHTHQYGDWGYADETNHSAACECGDIKTEAHAWDEGVVNPEGTEKVYTCSVCGGTKSEALEEGELTLIFLANDFSRPYGDPIVADTDSPEGSAVKYSYADRVAAKETNPNAPNPLAMIRVGEQTLEMYSRVDPSTLVGSLSIAQLNANSGNGYVLYKFADVNIMPAPAADSFLYLFDCWGFQVKLNDYKDVLTGQTVNVYLSMKITGDVTNTTDNTPTYYIDKVVITTGTYGDEHAHEYGDWGYADETNHSASCECGDIKTEAHAWDEGVVNPEGTEKVYTCSVCGGTKTEVLELTLIFRADDFSRPYAADYGVDPIVIDGESANGKAVMYSYADRKPIKDMNSGAPSHMAMIRVEPQTLDIRTNNNIVVGSFSVSELKEAGDAGYVLYKFENVQLTDANFIYIFDCWGFQVPLTSHKDALRNLSVNVYLSMKITGDVTNTSNNTPAYYIDEVVITTGEYQSSGQTHSYGDWVYVDENSHSASCTHCDDVVTDGHIWDEGEVTLKPTVDAEGEKTFTCTLCGGTKVEPINKVNPEGINIVFYPDQFFLAYGDPVVSDSSAEGGKAAKFDYAARFATGDKGLYNALIFGGDHMLDVRTNNNIEVGRLSAAKLMKNASKGKYLTYKFSNVDLTGAGFIYLFDCWGFQVKLGEYADILKNEKVYVYVTLKVTGNVGDRENDTPTYYISKVEISSKNREVDSDKKDPVNILLTPKDFAMPYGTDSIKSDSQSKYGKAAVFSYEKRLASGDKGLYNAMIFGGDRALELYSHGGDPKQGNLLGSISNERMNYHANKDGYVVYTFKNVKMIPTAGSYLFYMFDCWGMNIPLSAEYVEEMQGRRVDISVSMKITGNVMNPNDPPTYYIDYIKIVSTSGSGCAHDYNDWVVVDGNEHSRECLACGNILTEEHKWDEGVAAEGLPEGHKLFTCADCGATSQGEQPGQLVDSDTPEEEHTHSYTEYTSVDENQHTAACADCGEELTENHTWDQGTVAQEATTEKAGEMLYTCTACGATKSEPIEKLTDSTEAPFVDDGGFISSEILTWAIMVGIADLAAIIFIVVLIKKRKKK